MESESHAQQAESLHRAGPISARLSPASMLFALACVQLAIYAAVTFVSGRFDYNAPVAQRPIPVVLGLLWLNFVLHLFSLWWAIKCRERTAFRIVVIGSVAFRAVMIFSTPIQEVDIYRYCWDGAVLTSGVSPFRYSPEQIRIARTAALVEDAGQSIGLQKLVELRDSDRGLDQILQRVHYAELTTIYPPVSQLVFALADVLTPKNSALAVRILIMKVVIVAFDLAVLAVLSSLLTVTNRHQAWLVVYGWSPLILKEFANSGHLDSIAVLFTCLAILAFLHAVAGSKSHRGWLSASSILLACGIGAKLYPVILVPLLACILLFRDGLRKASLFGVGTTLVATLLMMPMLISVFTDADVEANDSAERQIQASSDGTAEALPPLPSFTDSEAEELPPLPTETNFAESEPGASEMAVLTPLQGQSADSGLSTFVARWEMNDLIFMFVEENLRPNTETRPTAWFVLLPNEARESSVRLAVEWLGCSKSRAPFLLARILTLAIFSGLVLSFSIRAALDCKEAGGERPLIIVRFAFLTVAWFWLLSPTQNPWYWSWALPLVAFARSRIWLVVSGLALIYYLRFWFLYQYSDQDVMSTGYVGARFFDFVIVWFEFMPLFVLLALASVRRLVGAGVLRNRSLNKSSTVDVE